MKRLPQFIAELRLVAAKLDAIASETTHPSWSRVPSSFEPALTSLLGDVNDAIERVFVARKQVAQSADS